MAITDNDKVVTIPDGLEDGTVLCYDISNNRFIDSGVKAKYGSVFMDSGALLLGAHEVSGSGENVVFKNTSTDKIYYPSWKEVDPTGKEERPMTSRKFTSELREASIGSTLTSVLTNPDFKTQVSSKSTVFQAEVIFIQAYTNVIVEIFYGDTGKQFWKSVIPHVSAGKQKVQLEVPVDVYPGELRFKIFLASGEPIELRGDREGHPYLNFFYRTFEEEPLATEAYVQSHAGSGSGDMLKSVYDTDDDGKVNLAVAADYAAALTGVQGISDNSYYGKDADGNVGFHSLPSASGDDFTNLAQGDVPYWDASDSTMKPSGIRKIASQTLVEPSGIYMGDVGVTTDGHGMLLSPIDDPKTYRVLMQAITANKDEALIKSYGDGQEKDIHTGYSQSVQDPTVSFTSDKDVTWVSMGVRLVAALKTLTVSITNQHGESIWQESFFNLDAGSNTLTLASPPDLLSSETITLRFSGESHTDKHVLLEGTDSTPYLKVTLLPWTEKKIATEDYVSTGVEPLENSIQDIDHRIDNVDTTVSALAKRIGEFQNYFVYRGKTAPVFPDAYLAGYFSILYGLTKNEAVVLPSPTKVHDGTMFFFKNEDATYTLRVEAPTGSTINGGTSITLPPQTALWLVHQQNNWVVMMSGYLPTSHAALIAEIKSQVSSASLGITVDDGTTNYGDIKLLKLKGITADRPAGDSIDSVTLSAATTWGTLGDSTSNVKGTSVLAEPPLQAYADPNATDTVRLRLEEGTFEAIHAPGYLAYIETPISIIGKTFSKTTHADGVVYPLDVVVDNGTYIVKDMKAKAIGIQEADQGDPNVTGGTDYLVAFRIALEGEAPADGYVQIYLAEKAEFGQPVKYLEDVNGNPFVVRRYYHLGDKMGSLETVGIVNAKGLKEFTMHVVDSFDKDDINVLPRDKGVSGIMVQALLPTSKSGLASLQYEVDTEQNIEFTRYYASDAMTTIDWLSSYVMPVTEGVGGEGADFPDGIHLNNISNLMAGFVDGRMVIKDNGSNMVDFVFGKIEDAPTTRAMREKVLSVKLTLTNKDSAFRVALVKWTGNPDEYTQEIFNSRSNGSPVFQSGWSLSDSLFIPEDIANEDHEVTHEFTVPKDANNYAVVIYPEAEQQPLELKLKKFNVGAKTPFYYYVLHQSRKLNELHLEFDKEFYESVQDATGLYSLRYTLSDGAEGLPMPCGTRRKGKAAITLDPTVNQVPSSGASGGEGALKFGKDGEATINTLLNIASEQAQGTNHPTEFWWVTVAADGTMKEIPNSRTTFPISGGSSGTYPMTPFTLAVEAGDRIALRGKTDMPDGAYIISFEGKVPLVDVTIDFKELVTTTSDDPFASLDLQQFDFVYPHGLTVVKVFANANAVSFNIDIGDADTLTVLGVWTFGGSKELAEGDLLILNAATEQDEARSWIHNGGTSGTAQDFTALASDVDAAIQAAVTSVIGGASNAYNTLGKAEALHTQLEGRVATAETEIDTLQSQVALRPEFKSAIASAWNDNGDGTFTAGVANPYNSTSVQIQVQTDSGAGSWEYVFSPAFDMDISASAIEVTTNSASLAAKSVKFVMSGIVVI